MELVKIVRDGNILTIFVNRDQRAEFNSSEQNIGSLEDQVSVSVNMLIDFLVKDSIAHNESLNRETVSPNRWWIPWRWKE
jgi:hypothetical protein